MSYRDKTYSTMKLTFEDQIAIVRFDRPEAMNAANVDMSYERVEIYRHLSEDDTVKVIIITGGDKVYCAGGDLAAFSKFNRSEAQKFINRGVEYQKLLMDMPKPTIAAIAGYAYGGGMENVLLCDLRIAADNAKFALPEIGVGIFPGGGATQRLVQNIPIAKAKEMIFFGKPIEAKEAYHLGIVNKVVEPEQLMEEARAWAKRLLRLSPLSLRSAKKAINNAWNQDIYGGMQQEADLWAELFDSHDQKEGMNAFLEKRYPEFRGN
ncbi:enoyl-CoA hydratase/isomerase family protein [Lacrimispora sp.]|uniref:enoyl-CoA hydratase/isomerase family protein n=1 Tax=Lacrimispora sp. TaxID=2719234 RepID=UPI0028B0BD4B|nr:enoyl-CoA hydratase/isomerase family protein [Lacrimispora sp.]